MDMDAIGDVGGEAKSSTKKPVEEDRPSLNVEHLIAQVNGIQIYLGSERNNPNKDMSQRMESYGKA